MDRLGERSWRKKLEAAARFWARGGKHDGPYAKDDLIFFGVPDTEAQKWAGDDEPEDCFVDADNWHVLLAFLALATQWQIVSGMGGAYYQGIRYETMDLVFRMQKVAADDQPEVFEKLQAMEAAARDVLNKPKDSPKETQNG